MDAQLNDPQVRERQEGKTQLDLMRFFQKGKEKEKELDPKRPLGWASGFEHST